MSANLKKRIKVNGNWHECASSTLEELVLELDYAGSTIATAKNHEFVRIKQRHETPIVEGDEIEILIPMQGG